MTMNWHTGNIAEAVAESKTKDAIFVVYIEGQDEMSAQLDRFLNDSRVYSKLETNDFVAVKVQGGSAAYTQFSSLYKVVPVPSIFFIGKTGTPLDIATGVTGSVDELVAKIDKVLLLAGKQEHQNEASTSLAASVLSVQQDTQRHIAGAESDVPSDEPTEEPTEATTEAATNQPTEQTVPEPEHITEPTSAEQTSVPAEQTEQEEPAAAEQTTTEQTETQQQATTESAPAEEHQSAETSSATADSTAHESSVAALTAAAAAERRAAATATATAAAAATTATAAAATTSAILPNALGSLMPNSVSFVPAVDLASQQSSATNLSDAETRMTHIQQLIDLKKREREEEQQKRERENELRRRREGRDSQAQQVLTKEQEIKNMQERIRRERQQEQQARERILAQIAADRAEHATRNSHNADVQSINTVTTATTATVISAEPSVSSVNETRLQIRLPGGLTSTKAFAANEPLSTVRIYVMNELLAGSDIREFTLATSYPRREFKLEEEAKTLVDLNLVPNAVLLVLKRAHNNSMVRSSSNLLSILTSVFWAILTPAAIAFEYLNKMGLQRLRERFVQMVTNVGWRKAPEPSTGTPNATDAAARRNLDLFVLGATPAPGKPENTQDQDAAEQQPPHVQHTQSAADATKTQKSGGGGGFRPKRYGEPNIRRLADTQKDDDDKATYNGNSTQQQ